MSNKTRGAKGPADCSEPFLPPPKTEEEQLRTIEVFGFGVENYTLRDGNYYKNGGTT